MLSLFIKFFIAGVGFLILLVILNQIFSLFTPPWITARHRKIFKPLFTGGMYYKAVVLQAAKHYIPPKCQASLKRSASQKDLTLLITRFIERKPSSRNLIILAEPGMGKTTFALNIYLNNALLRESARKYTIVLIHLGFKHADKMIKDAPDKENTVLFLDGLDEDTQAFDDPGTRIFNLMESAAEFRKIIFTASQDFIPENQIKTLKTGYEKQWETSPASSNQYKTNFIYLAPMTYSRAKKIVDQTLGFWQNSTKKKMLDYIQSNSAGVTPFTLKYLPQILPKEPMLLSKNYIYQQIILYWLEDQHTWSEKNILYHFIGQLAVDLFSNRSTRKEESIPAEKVHAWFKSWNAQLKPVSKDHRTLICQDYSGMIRFTHRSVMEYLFVQQLILANKQCYQKILTPQMKLFFLESLIDQVSGSLPEALMWLKPFQLKAQGLSLKDKDRQSENRQPLFQTILKKNPQFGFLSHLSRLLKNPVFKEFGWDPQLHENLKKARYQSKSSFMELKEKRQNVLITSSQIEISQKSQKTKQIKLSQTIFEEYERLIESDVSTQLCERVGIEGLKMITRLNRSGKLALLPDLDTFDTFTLFFWKKIFDTTH